MSNHHQSPNSQHLISAALTLSIVLPPLLLGSTTPLITAALSLAFAALALYALWRRRALGLSAHLSPLTLAAVLIAGAAALQLIPLPHSLLESLSPVNALARQELAGILSIDNGGSLSLSPAQTALAAGRWLGLGFAAFALSNLLRLHDNPRKLLTWTAASFALLGVSQVLIGIFNTLTGGDHILGFTISGNPSLAIVTGTFVNSNHAGVILAISTTSSLGLSLSRHLSTPWRYAAGAAAALSSSGLLLTGSRGAILALSLALLLCGLIAASRLRDDFSWPSPGQAFFGTLTLAGAATALGALTVVAGWWQRISFELGKTRSLEDLLNSPRARIFDAVAPIINDFSVTGIGADAFAVVSPLYVSNHLATRHSFIESDLPELFVTMGVPVAIIALLIPGITAWRHWKHGKPLTGQVRILSLALLGALCAFIFSSTLSFNVVIAGTAIPAIALSEVLLNSRRPEREPSLSTSYAGFALLLAAGLALVCFAASHHLSSRQAALQPLLKEDNLTAAEILATTRDVAALLPTDGFSLGQAALALLNAQPDGPPPETSAIARRAVELAPHAPLTHLALARTLTHIGELEDAANSYRELLERSLAPNMAITPEILLSLPTGKLRAMALPPTARYLKALMAWCRDKKLVTVTLDMAVELQSLHPDSFNALLFAAEAALTAGQPRLHEFYALQMIAEHKLMPHGYLLNANALVAQGQFEEALSTLSRGLDLIPNQHNLRFRRVELLLYDKAKLDQPKRLESDLKHLKQEVIDNTILRSKAFYLSGLRWKRLNSPQKAQLDFNRAARLNPAYQKLSTDQARP